MEIVSTGCVGVAWSLAIMMGLSARAVAKDEDDEEKAEVAAIVVNGMDVADGEARRSDDMGGSEEGAITRAGPKDTDAFDEAGADDKEALESEAHEIVAATAACAGRIVAVTEGLKSTGRGGGVGTAD